MLNALPRNQLIIIINVSNAWTGEIGVQEIKQHINVIVWIETAVHHYLHKRYVSLTRLIRHKHILDPKCLGCPNIARKIIKTIIPLRLKLFFSIFHEYNTVYKRNNSKDLHFKITGMRNIQGGPMKKKQGRFLMIWV